MACAASSRMSHPTTLWPRSPRTSVRWQPRSTKSPIAASGQVVSALENRIDTLANALNASAEAGHAVPRELERLLAGLIEKLEWVQLTHTDHAALGHLEDRIAQLIKRLDASDARLGNLEAVERGLADLLVHINEARAGGAPGPQTRPAAAAAMQRDTAE